MNNKNDQAKAKEIWVLCKFIANDGTLEEYPGYEVSNFGRVRSLNYHRTRKTGVLKPIPAVHSNGTYHMAALCKYNKRYARSVHRLVLSSFNPKGYFKGAVTDHIDSNPLNNELSNLRWITQQENCSTSHCKALRINRPDQSKRVQVTFLDDNHIEIFSSTQEAARSLGLPTGTVSVYIRRHNGYYKKLNVLFEYV